ncbi:MAG TPA: efflux RND transporter periplasmic adaptor subunit [Longimicrobiales bacterium]|nr:efflux RND transporter periplasmic adaptor subunit [Longimicrobiales bacterium]
MHTRTKVIIGIAVVVVFGSAAALSIVKGRNRGLEVRMEEVARRDLVQIVTASGNIRARRLVELSSDISAKVSQLLVDEGDDVQQGDVLLRLDPAQYQAGVSRAEATLSQAKASQAQMEANLLRTRRDLDRFLALRARDSLLVSTQQVDDARTGLEVGEAQLRSAEFGVNQAQASLEEAQDRLSKTIIRAPITGKVTRLNVEEGETVIIGTMNNAGSLILTISDLSVIEAVAQVDETDVPQVALGDSATVHIDAFPDRDFTGRVTEIGNSAIRPPSQQATGQQAAIDFEVVITLDPTDAELRPDLSATADIVTDVRAGVLSVPIIALTVREPEADSAAAEGEPAAGTPAPAAVVQNGENKDQEGVFLVRDRKVTFTPVKVGIAGQEYFEVLSGLNVGDTVVAGPYQSIRQLKNGDAVKKLEVPDSASSK